jgi:signal transduction histidine kinase
LNISDIIDLSVVELGALELSLVQVQLGECVESCLRLVMQRAAGRSIIITTTGLTSIPKIIADDRRVKQVVLNLLTNAIKFSDIGGSIEIEGKSNSSGDCKLIVRDTGNGIGPDALKHVLEIFRRGDEPMVRKVEGSGLGLPLSNNIVRAHGGTLTIESELGVGTTVSVNFPARPPNC